MYITTITACEFKIQCRPVWTILDHDRYGSTSHHLGLTRINKHLS
jgi:hypothetical protein